MPDSPLIPLAFENQPVRASSVEDMTLFVAEDVCAALGISKHRDAVAKLDTDERGSLEVDTLGGRQVVAAVTEAGLYTLALRCRDAMTPGTAPYRFRKWVTGTALPALRRGHEPTVVTGFDKETMNALGGMVKKIVQKALIDLREPLGDAALLSQHAAVNRGYTAGEVLDEAGVTDRRGMRSIINRVSHSIRRYAAEKHMLVGMGRLGSSKAYVFDGSLVRVWLRDGGGKQMIDRLVAERSGQGALRLAFKKG